MRVITLFSTEIAHFILCDKIITVIKLENLFIKHIVYLHKLPNSIILKKFHIYYSIGVILISLFQNEQKLFITFYFMTKEKSENVIDILEQYL